MTKKLKRVFSLFLAILMVASMPMSASAASISSNKKKATKVVGGQTIYITTNSTVLASAGGATDITIVIPSNCAQYYQNKKASAINSTARIKLTTYKKVGSKWVHYRTTRHICNAAGYVKSNDGNSVYTALLKSCLELPGRNVQYKVTITPEVNSATKEWGGIYKASDMKNITVSVDTGKITKVA